MSERYRTTIDIAAAPDHVFDSCHRQLLLNWFAARGTIALGAVEGLNNKLKVITRRAYGFRSFRKAEIALHHALGDLPEPDSARRFC